MTKREKDFLQQALKKQAAEAARLIGLLRCKGVLSQPEDRLVSALETFRSNILKGNPGGITSVRASKELATALTVANNSTAR